MSNYDPFFRSPNDPVNPSNPETDRNRMIEPQDSGMAWAWLLGGLVVVAVMVYAFTGTNTQQASNQPSPPAATTPAPAPNPPAPAR